MKTGEKWNGWTVESEIGKGTFGTVYKIVREEFGHTYESALKVISIPQDEAEISAFRNEGMDDESITSYYRGMVEDIVSEFVIMSELRGNSNIVSYEDHSYKEKADSFGWEIFIRMEMLTPLLEYMKDHPFTCDDAVQLGIDICKALELCQKYNIIHRDIKPENIFVSKFGDYKLGDFGIAKKLENATLSMSKKGTYTYMAPEVFRGESYKPSVDTYSLGIVLYRMLNNNRTPFLPPYPQPIYYSDREKALNRRLRGESLPKPCLAEGKLGDIVLKACAFDPADRFESPLAMREALESLSSQETSSRDISLQEPFEEGSTESLIVKDFEESTLLLTEPLGEEKFEEHTLPLTEPLTGGAFEEHTLPLIEPEKPAPAAKESSRKKKNIPVIAAIILLACGICGIGVYKYFNHQVPDVVGLSAEDAQNEISQAGLVSVEEREFSDNVDRGLVISQTNQGESVKRNTEITLTISAGKPVKVPDLTGYTEKEAKKKAKKLGLIITVDGEELSDDIQKGGVTGQSPKAGSKCEAETEIKVIISKGIVQVEVPDVVGKTAEKAENALNKAGLNSDIVYVYSSEEAGIIIEQSAEAGKSVDKHSTVTITASAGPAPQKSKSKGSSSKKKKSSGSSSSSGDWDVGF